MALLFTADMHLRHDQPKCRTDDFSKAQNNKLGFIQQLLKTHRAFWIDAGDVFHKAKPPYLLTSGAAQFFSETYVADDYVMYMIAGNHDLPAHNMASFKESALGVLDAADLLYLLGKRPIAMEVAMGPRDEPIIYQVYGASYGEEIPTPNTALPCILVYHGMLFSDKKSAIPGVAGATARQFLIKHKGFDLIVTGHNHKSFHCEIDGRLLVNVGSLTRQTADQFDHVPRVFLWRGAGDWEWIDVPHEKGVISRQHLDKLQEKEQRTSAFVEQLGDIEDISLSFEANVDQIIHRTKPKQETINQIRKAME